MPLTIDPALGLDVATDAVARAKKAGADGAQVRHTYGERFEVNFDTHDVTLVRTTVTDELAITVYDGTRKGSTDLTGRAHDAVDRAVEEALTAARAGEPDPANVVPDVAVAPAASAGDLEPDADAMVDAVLAHIARMKSDYPAIRTDSSLYVFNGVWSSYADSNDRVQHARRSRYVLQLTVTGRDEARVMSTSFNYTVQMSASPFPEQARLPSVKLLLDGTIASFDAETVPATFVGDVIFTPMAATTLVGGVASRLTGIALMQKTTPYLERLGTGVAGSGTSILHRPSELAGAPAFDADGFRNDDLDIVLDGVLENYIVDWYASRKLGRPRTTGSANLVVPAGDVTLDDLIAGTERGILLGRFSGGMPNAKLDFAGVAKNSFYIEDGRIQHPLTETMVAGNLADVLESVHARSSECIDFGMAKLPWIASRGVTISTK